MKVAIITNTCYEEIIPLAKHLSSTINVNLFATISQRGSGRQLLFEKDDLWMNEKPGLIFNIDRKQYIADEFNNYINSKFNLHAVFFKTLAYFHPKNFKIIKDFIQFLKKEKYDLIHFNINTHLIFFIKAFLPSVPFVITIHDPVPHLGEESFLYSALDKITSKLRNATYILHSNYSLALFDNINRNKSKRFMIRFGNHEWLNEYKKQDSIRKYGLILFIGRISKYKGIDVLLKSFQQVKQEIPEASLIIAGNGDYWFDYTKYINGSSIEIINRYIPNKEIVKLLMQSHIVVLPYTEATQSGVVSTVFTFYKPIVATKTGGIPEVVKDDETGLLVEPNDSKALSNAIIRIIQSEILYNTIKKNISNIYNEGEFSWKEISSKTELVYLSVVGKKR
jgi:glycosyltransferase involved in cell wall biosynthesis